MQAYYMGTNCRTQARQSLNKPKGYTAISKKTGGNAGLIQALQLADVAAHTISRKVHGSDPLNWFGNLEPFLAKHWSTGDYKNAGLTYIQ